MTDIIKKMILVQLNDAGKKEENCLKRQCKKEYIDYEKLKAQAIKSAKKIQRQVKKIGGIANKDSFFTMVENYIDKKSEFTEKEKKDYLKVLVLLSELYDFDVKEELLLQKKQFNIRKKEKIELERRLLIYYLDFGDISEYEKIQCLADKHHISFHQLDKKTKDYVLKIKALSTPFAIETTKEGFKKFIQSYNKTKTTLSDEKKAKYLRLFILLADIYEINLRSFFTKHSKNKLKDPLQDDSFLSYIIKERYSNSYFAIEEMYENEKEYSFLQEQLLLLKEIIRRALSDENLKIKKEFLYMKEIKNINKKNVQTLQPLLKTIDYHDKHIGISDKILFSLPKDPSVMAFHLFIPNSKEKYIFLNQYILKCLEQHINYDMWCENEIILYSSLKDFSIKQKIIGMIKKENENLFKKVIPLKHTALVQNTSYGLTCVKIENIYLDDYSFYFNHLVSLSYYRTISKIVLNKMVIPEEKEIIQNFILLKEMKIISIEELSFSFNGISFDEIKDVINKYLPDIKGTLQIYMEEKIDTFREEFKKSMQYIANLITNHNKKAKINIAFTITKDV